MCSLASFSLFSLVSFAEFQPSLKAPPMLLNIPIYKKDILYIKIKKTDKISVF